MFLMRCAVCYHLYNLRNLKSTLGGVLLLVKLQTKSCCKKPAPKNFAYSQKNTIPATLLKRDSNTGVFLCEYCKIFKNTYFKIEQK